MDSVAHLPDRQALERIPDAIRELDRILNARLLNASDTLTARAEWRRLVAIKRHLADFYGPELERVASALLEQLRKDGDAT